MPQQTEELDIKDYGESISSLLEADDSLYGDIDTFKEFDLEDTIDDENTLSEAEIVAILQKMPPELLKSGVIQQVIVTARNGKRVEIDGVNNRINFYADDGKNAIRFLFEDGTSVADILTFFNAINSVSGVEISSGGASFLSLTGKSNLGTLFLGFDNVTNAGGISQSWSGNDLPGTVNSAITSRLSYNRTDLTLGVAFSITAASMLTPYLQLTGAAARTSDGTTAIADGTNTGQVIILEGTDNTNTITIQNAANVRLAGAANITLGQYDTVTLVFNGTDWVEVCRSNN